MTRRLAAPILLVIFVVLATAAAGTKSATFDESVHIFSGWRVLTQGDFTTNHEHPPLMKVLAALPLVVSGANPPRAEMRREVDEWNVAHDFVYHANDGDSVLRRARLPITLLATVLAWVVYRCAAAAFGFWGGLTALVLLIFEPNILAHSGLVTTDLGSAAFFFFTYAAFMKHLRTRRRGWMIAAGLLFGGALLTRFTAVLLVPILIVCGLLFVHLEGSKRWRELAISLTIVGAIGLAVLNAGYGFGGTFSTLRGFAPESQSFRDHAAGALGGLPLPVPLEYVRGFDHAEAGGQRWWAYLFGQYSQTGWRHYFLAALAVKTTIPLLVLSVAGILFWRRRVKPTEALLPQAPLLIYLGVFALSTNLKNIGLRYVLPVYPFLCLIAASVAPAAAAAPTPAARAGKSPPVAAPTRFRLVAALMIWQAILAAWMYPDYLTYFNMTVGGPSRGAEVLLDSNLDWGQDLKGLGGFIRQRRIEKIYVDYFGRACQRYYGVKSTPDFEGGWIAVSATNLKGVYAEDKDRYRFLSGVKPEAILGGSIFVYNVARPEGWKSRNAAPGD